MVSRRYCCTQIRPRSADRFFGRLSSQLSRVIRNSSASLMVLSNPLPRHGCIWRGSHAARISGDAYRRCGRSSNKSKSHASKQGRANRVPAQIEQLHAGETRSIEARPPRRSMTDQPSPAHDRRSERGETLSQLRVCDRMVPGGNSTNRLVTHSSNNRRHSNGFCVAAAAAAAARACC